MASEPLVVSREDLTGTSINPNNWECFAEILAAAYAQAPKTEGAMADLLRPATHQFYNWIVSDPEFRNEFLRCPDSIGRGSPTWSTTLFSDDNINAGLLAVYRDKPVPFHDHPGTLGVMLVLSGAVKIQYANLVNEQDAFGPVELQITRVRERLPGEVCWFFANDRNIHQLEATTANTVILVAHLPHIDINQQSFYFPFGEYEPVEGCTLLAQRIRLKRSRSGSSHFQ
jgi:hypothetical protein